MGMVKNIEKILEKRTENKLISVRRNRYSNVSGRNKDLIGWGEFACSFSSLVKQNTCTP